MANSKSNIYPIQLQGAELNLNKYDAEIKQYSGFNKNNSPFVGGCLSNVFTKEEQITGGNADNIYIATNGDVYKVDTEGLYKNEEKIIDYSPSNARPNGMFFFQKRKLNINNVVKAISETVYITIESQITCPRDSGIWQSNDYISSGYVAHWGNGYSAFICDVTSYHMLILDIAYKNGKIAFTAKKDFNNGGDQRSTLNYLIYVPDENDSYYKEVSNRTLSGRNHDDFCYTRNICSFETIEVPQVVYFAADGLFWAQNMPWFSRTIYMDYETETCHPSFSFTVPSGIESSVFDTDFNSWFMTNEGKLHLYYYGFQNTNYPENYITDPTAKTKVLSGSGWKYFEQVLQLSYENDSFVAASTTSYYSDITIALPSGAEKTFTGMSPNSVDSSGKWLFGFFKSYGCQYISLFPELNNMEYGIHLSYCQDKVNFGVSIDNDRKLSIPGGGQFFLEPFKVLVNNNEISNLSVYCTSRVIVKREKYSVQGNIVEDWNTIKRIEYIDNDKCVYYTYNEEWFIVEKSAPKLMLKYNQLVVNCGYELNAYDLVQNKVTHFAPDWNACYVRFLYNSMINRVNSYTRLDGIIRVASAINEYDLKDNPSLLINEISITGGLGQIGTDYFVDVLGEFMSYVYISLLKDNGINVYWNRKNGTSIDVCEYSFTGSIFSFKNPDLEGLPFPNNTDGNVMYCPNLFSEFIYNFGIDVFIKNNKNVYQLMKQGQENVMAFYLGTLVEGLDKVFVIQGQYFGIIDNKIFALQFQSGVIADSVFIVNIQGLQFVGNTPYEALFFSKTNRCLYSFTGANVLNQKQLVDKISEVRNYLYNPATQTVFLITDIGVLFYGLFGQFLLEYLNITNIFLLDNGIVLSDNSGNYRYIKYYLDEGDEGYTKENIRLETCFYGMNNEVVTINDCLYFRLFSEEHEEGDLKVSATTISLSGRKTEETTFKIKASDWDKITHTIYLRYQPKTQRGLGVSFSIDSPFKIASMSVGSQPDAVLVDKVSKGAITAPSVTTNNNEW